MSVTTATTLPNSLALLLLWVLPLQLPPAARPPEPPRGAAVLDVAGNFCNLVDAQGRVVYTPALPGATPEIYDEWMRLQREAGSTHVFVGPFTPGPAYPGAAWSNPDLLGDPAALRAFVLKVLATPGAGGTAFVPVIFLDGGGRDPRGRIERDWPRIAKALDGVHDSLLIVPAWEPVAGAWTSADLSFALERVAALFPSAVIGWHGSPSRWSGASRPLEADDPWQGSDAAFFRSHGGQRISVALYQTPHGLELWRDCDEDRDEACWARTFQTGVRQLGTGADGFRRVKVVLFETVAYEAFRGRATAAHAREAATIGQRICRKWKVACGFGNGLPLKLPLG